MPPDLDGLAELISDAIFVATAPLLARIVVLEQAKAAAPAIDFEVLATKAAALVQLPRDGRDAGVDLAALATKAAARMPTPKDGKDGRDGSSVTVDDLAPVIAAEVTKAVAAVPRARDGVDGAAGAPGRDGRDGLPGAAGERGPAGDAGPAGPIGAKGEAGAPGERGSDGVDGLGFDEMDLVVDEAEKLVALEWTKGDRVIRRPLPVSLDVGVYSDAETYRKGNTVSRGGSMWIALLDQIKGIRPDDATEDGLRAWRLCVQRGKAGKQGQQGPPGNPGRDLRWEDK